jgi:predicted acylesterase/phospholipase RssA
MATIMTASTPRIGLALSGGGFRATAFGLGCLRALHDFDLLKQVRVVSGISGGSLLTAMWAYGPDAFEEFDDSVTSLLRTGLHLELIRRTFSLHSARRNVLSVSKSAVTRRPRSHNRTDSLVAALSAREFGTKALPDVTHQSLATVISATDMTTANAVRFGSEVSSCAPHGQIINTIVVAEAVAASAAFPILLPALSRQYDFQTRDGTRSTKTVVMTDGGVYDNLGLSPLLPGRSRKHTSHVYDLDYLIAADAGRGSSERAAARFMPRRLMQSFEITYSKTQDASRSRIHVAGETGQIRGFIHSYLGMRDRNLPAPVRDLVPRSRVGTYPTNFAKMSYDDLAAISVRGEQLTRVLLAHYCPELTI